MASIEQRQTPAGHDVWVVRFREDGRSRSRSFRSEFKAKQWMAKHQSAKPRLKFPANFWVRVDMTSQAPCWIWTGANDGRYGAHRFPLSGRNEKAHRIMWYLTHGETVPEGMTIDHLCRQTLCVNPAHLDVCTQAENTRRIPLSRHSCEWCGEAFRSRQNKPRFCSAQCRVKSEIAPRWQEFKTTNDL